MSPYYAQPRPFRIIVCDGPLKLPSFGGDGGHGLIVLVVVRYGGEVAVGEEQEVVLTDLHAAAKERQIVQYRQLPRLHLAGVVLHDGVVFSQLPCSRLQALVVLPPCVEALLR